MFKLLQAKTILKYGRTTSFFELFSNRTTGNTNSMLPYKHNKKKVLTKEQKEHNHIVSSSRVQVEHIIREIKVFRVLAERYRNRRKRFGLRVNLIAGIYNYELNSVLINTRGLI